MHDVILDKDFAKNRTIYLAYITTPEGKTGSVGYIASAKLAADDKSVTDWRVLKEGNMSPRRLLQAKDGTLFAVAADVITPYKATQDMMSPQGKVLRINTDGTIPKDNPFVGKPNTDESIWAIGFRDTQGLAFRGDEIWLAENEPRGGDEFNRVERGKNYGFPLISYGRDNNGALLNNGKTQMAGMEQPIYYWTPSIALSGLAFYTGDKMPEWKGDAFIGGLSGLQVIRLKLAPDGHVIGEEKLLRDRCSRMRDVRQGPDGLLYVLTDADAGEVLRISPAK
jgi:glucose/arabinose dehydrogenase